MFIYLNLANRSSKKASCNSQVFFCFINLKRYLFHKKFIISNGNKFEDIGFDDAVKFFECKPDCPKSHITKEYYDLLSFNKLQFANLNADEEEIVVKKSGATNHKEVKLRIEFAIKEGKLTDTQEEYLAKVLKLYDNGSVLAETSKKIKDEISKTLDSQDVYNSVKANIPETYLTNKQEKLKKDDEIIEVTLHNDLEMDILPLNNNLEDTIDLSKLVISDEEK